MTLDAALDTFCRARHAYDAAAATSKERWYDADARAKCHLALARLQRAEQDLLSTWDEAHADPIPALLARIETTTTPRQVATPEALEERVAGAI